MFINELLYPVVDVSLDATRVFLVDANYLRLWPDYPFNIAFNTAAEA